MSPIWFAEDGAALVFRTKIGPKTARLTRDPRVRLQACNFAGEVKRGASAIDGQATILTGIEATRANARLQQRYGWQYNVVPLLKIPGVHNVHSALPLREKLRRVRDSDVWTDSAIVRIEF